MIIHFFTHGKRGILICPCFNAVRKLETPVPPDHSAPPLSAQPDSLLSWLSPAGQRFWSELGIPHPVIQAPMAGGGSTPALVASVAEHGGLGYLAAGMLSPARIRADMAEIRARTRRPFGVNLFVLDLPAIDPQREAPMLACLAPVYEALGLPLPDLAALRLAEAFADQIDAVLETPPAVLSFTFGVPSPEVCSRVKAAGCRLVGTATHLAEALAWQAAGADALCAQGLEAGGHRGSFLPAPGDTTTDGVAVAGEGLVSLIPGLVRALSIPVFAAGGIMDGAGIRAALCLGAAGAQLGTAFLASHESGVPGVWKAALPAAAARGTRLTRAFSGRWARGIPNGLMARIDGAGLEIPPYPVQNALTTPLRAAAATRGRPEDGELLALWAGQGAARAEARPAGELLDRWLAEAMGRVGRMES